MQTEMPRYPLSVGLQGTRAIRIVSVALLGGMAVVASGCAGALLGMAGTAVVASADHAAVDKWGWVPAVLGGAVAAGALLLYVVLTIAMIIRRGAWLEGTWLTVRVLRERSVDLTAARSVALRQSNQRLVGPVRWTGVIGPPQMVAELDVTAGDGRRVQLRLASPDGIQLPPDQLLALAGALSLARCPGAAETVAWLRGTAMHASVR